MEAAYLIHYITMTLLKKEHLHHHYHYHQQRQLYPFTQPYSSELVTKPVLILLHTSFEADPSTTLLIHLIFQLFDKLVDGFLLLLGVLVLLAIAILALLVCIVRRIPHALQTYTYTYMDIFMS